MRHVSGILVGLVLACASCAGIKARAPHVLFVGNSLTYVGNAPAVFTALAATNGHPVTSDMIVKGGATLSERVADRSVERALLSGDYDAVVLQERGGDLTCSFGPASCVQSLHAIKQLAALAKENGAKIVLLGSYQANPLASREIVAAESGAADEAAIPYVEVSEKLQRLKRAAPELQWFAADGMHPGPALTLLDAVVIYRELFGGSPEPRALTVHAPIYGVNSGLTEILRPADAPPPHPETPVEVVYPLSEVQKLLFSLHPRSS